MGGGAQRSAARLSIWPLRLRRPCGPRSSIRTPSRCASAPAHRPVPPPTPAGAHDTAKRRRGREGEQGKKKRRERQRRGAYIVYASANGRRRIADSRSPPPTRNGRAVGISPPPSERDAFCPHICLSCLPQPCPRSPAILALLVTSLSPAHPEHGHRFHHHRTEVSGTTQIGLPTHLTAPDHSNFRRTLYASTILSYRH